jgi:hypothetical protein
LETKIGNPKIEANVESILQNANKLVTVDFVAKALKISWVTTRAILYEMALNGRVKIVKTTNNLQYFTKT